MAWTPYKYGTKNYSPTPTHNAALNIDANIRALADNFDNFDGYISGLRLLWSSTSQIQVGTGAAYSNAAGGFVKVASPFTVTPGSLSANTWNYAYLDGPTGIVVSTAAPGSPYSGYARQDGSNRRYLGCFKTDGSANILKFLRTKEGQHFHQIGTIASLVLSGGTATSATSVDCSAWVPPTSQVAKIWALNNGASTAWLGNSDNPPTPTDNGWVHCGLGTPSLYLPFSTDLPLSADQQFQYCYDTTPGGSGLIVAVNGFVEDL